MNRAITRMFIFGVLLFAALVANLAYLQVVDAAKLQQEPSNHRPIAEALRVQRGLILGFDGSTIVGDRKQSGFYTRTYPQGAVAPQLIGYDSVRYGRSGLEASLNDFLSGRAATGWQGFLDDVLGRRPRGDNVTLTIVPAVQKVAQQALGAQRGAIVALDPRTGAVLAAASSPSYDPRTLDQEWARLTSNPGRPLLNRATQGLYPPGSSFKVVTATAALDLGKVTPSTTFDDTGVYQIYGGKVTNFHGEVVGRNSFTEALTLSINTTFAKVGTLLGQHNLEEYMQRFGFWQVPPLTLPPGSVLASGRYGPKGLLPVSAPLNPLELAWMAVGQEQLLATPLQMALVAAAVADNGVLMKPYLVQQVTAPGGQVVQRAAPAVWRQVMQPQTATVLNGMMQQVVKAGTGTAAALVGIKVAGKTGTAQKGTTNEGWFIAFAPADNPKVAVAVIIENTPYTGGDVAAPLAAQVLRTALAQPALP